jgi:hypothetical protein
MSKSTKVVALLLALTYISGCGLFSLDKTSDEVGDLIERNKKNWNDKEIESYKFTYNKTVGEVEQENIEVFVLNGVIDSVAVAGQEAESPDDFLTVDGLYEEIERNFNRDDRGNFRVRFNEEFSYPERYQMEPGEGVRGRGVVVTTFETNEESG